MPPRKPPRPTRKRRTREHIIGDLGVHHVEGYILRAGFTAERMIHDYGIDLFMTTYKKDGEIENDYVLFQLKATDHLKRTANLTAIRYRLDRADLDWWLAETFPVIFVVYDAQAADVAFWLYVQAHFERMKKRPSSRTKSVTVHIPAENVVNETAIRYFAAAKAAIQAQTRGVPHA